MGEFFCRDTCVPAPATAAPSHEESETEAGADTTSRPQPQRSGLVGILAGVTLGLCGVVFGLAQMRENSELRRDLDLLQENRSRLLALVQAKNARIAELDSTQEAREPAASEAPPPKPRAASVPRPEPPRRYRGIPYTFNNGTRHLPLVSLTFDGGSFANAANDILDTLNSRNVKATMFLTGHFIRRNPNLVRRMVLEGHDMGNHTNRHPHLTTWARDRTQTTLPEVTEAMLAEELIRANALFRKVTGRDFDPIWRAPYGEKNRRICGWAQRAGYLHVGWGQGRTWRENLDTNDWVPNEHTPGYHSPREVYEKIMRRAEEKPYGINGGIVLLHLGTVRKEPEKQVHLILGRLIDGLRGRGYRIVPVMEMVRESGVELRERGGRKRVES